MTHEFIDGGGKFEKIPIETLFLSSSGNTDIQKNHLNGLGEYIVSSGVENQGVIGKSNIIARIFQPNTITIDMFGNVFYRDFHYKMVTHARVFSLSPKSDDIDAETMLYLVTAMQHFSKIFSYSNMASWDKVKFLNLILPTVNNQIDVVFMRRYIATLKAERVTTLKAYLQAAGLNNTILSEGELAALDALRQNRVLWKEKTICGKDGTFDVVNTHSILKSQVVPGSGSIPYVGAGEANNSIQCYIDLDHSLIERSNAILIGGKTLVITYQEKEYFSNDSHNLALHYKLIENPNRDLQLFLVSSLYRSLKPKYHWGDSISKAKIKHDSFMLPVDIAGNIDYVFIKNLISAQIKLCIKNILDIKDIEISTTEDIIGQQAVHEHNIERFHPLREHLPYEVSQAAEPFEHYGGVDIILKRSPKVESSLTLMYAISPNAREKTQNAGKIALGIKTEDMIEGVLNTYSGVNSIVFHYWKNSTASIARLNSKISIVSPTQVPDGYMRRQEKGAVAFLLINYDPNECIPLHGYNILKIQRHKERRYLPFVTDLNVCHEAVE